MSTNVFPLDPVLELRKLAVNLAADRLGIERPVAECSRCCCRLYASDLRCDAIPCEAGCPALAQLEALYP